MTRRCCALLALAVLAACSDQTSGPSTPQGPDFAISDAAHGGNPDFFWRPPIGGSPTAGGTGVFNPSLSPTVSICAWDGSACTSTVATFANVPVGNGQYQVVWTVPVSSQTLYRIFVLLPGDPDPVVVGYADVWTAATKNQLKNVNTAEFVPITDGSMLPIKFRINTHCATGGCSEGFVNLEQGGIVRYKEGGASPSPGSSSRPSRAMTGS
jgi:hypothetical protein